jgi:hypothetical protein
VGDYWVQTDAQARGKGQAGHAGRVHCLSHVLSYVATQAFLLAVAIIVLDMDVALPGLVLALAVSGVTHYMADRREHGLMFKLARRLGKGGFMSLGVPRAKRSWTFSGSGMTVDGQEDMSVTIVVDDNPQLATGAWALDYSWHFLFGVFVPALILAAVR